jgi:DNA transformation protein
VTDDSFKDFVLDQLHTLEGITCRRMFGGYGLYKGPTFFGIIHNDQLFFRTDDDTRKPYIEQGMGPFQPNKKQTLKSYYEVPVEVIEDHEQLPQWAATAAACRK